VRRLPRRRDRLRSTTTPVGRGCPTPGPGRPAGRASTSLVPSLRTTIASTKTHHPLPPCEKGRRAKASGLAGRTNCPSSRPARGPTLNAPDMGPRPSSGVHEHWPAWALYGVTPPREARLTVAATALPRGGEGAARWAYADDPGRHASRPLVGPGSGAIDLLRLPDLQDRTRVLNCAKAAASRKSMVPDTG
jgi:hypothetical protein